jgi:hypothetical protein
MFSCLRTWMSCWFLFFVPSLTVLAWNATGHMVVANIAYQKLKPDVRSKVDTLISFMQMEYPNINSILQVAVWPDTIRSQKIETFTRWHYIDVPFTQDNSPLKPTVATDNALWAIQSIQAPLKNTHANNFERARLLAFFIHIVGDVHQPLHTVTRLSEVHPDGDRGGNLYFIRYNNAKMTLHSFWDQGLGLFSGPSTEESIDELTNTITALYPPSYFGAKADDLDPGHWIEEGMQNAMHITYNTPENAVPSADYVVLGQQVAQEETALAGYRLAALLNQIFVTATS